MSYANMIIGKKAEVKQKPIQNKKKVVRQLVMESWLNKNDGNIEHLFDQILKLSKLNTITTIENFKTSPNGYTEFDIIKNNIIDQKDRQSFYEFCKKHTST